MLWQFVLAPRVNNALAPAGACWRQGCLLECWHCLYSARGPPGVAHVPAAGVSDSSLFVS
jgi:hypothetical protein